MTGPSVWCPVWSVRLGQLNQMAIRRRDEATGSRTSRVVTFYVWISDKLQICHVRHRVGQFGGTDVGQNLIKYLNAWDFQLCCLWQNLRQIWPVVHFAFDELSVKYETKHVTLRQRWPFRLFFWFANFRTLGLSRQINLFSSNLPSYYSEPELCRLEHFSYAQSLPCTRRGGTLAGNLGTATFCFFFSSTVSFCVQLHKFNVQNYALLCALPQPPQPRAPHTLLCEIMAMAAGRRRPARLEPISRRAVPPSTGVCVCIAEWMWSSSRTCSIAGSSVWVTESH